MYGNATDFATYHEDRGRTIPVSWDSDAINAALLLCSEWLDNVYGGQFIGYKTDGFEQAFEWPRMAATTNIHPAHAFDDDEIPTRIINATYEAAFRELTTPGQLMIDYNPNKYKRVSIDGALSVEYAQTYGASDLQTQITIIDALVKPLLNHSYSSLSGSVTRT